MAVRKKSKTAKKVPIDQAVEMIPKKLGPSMEEIWATRPLKPPGEYPYFLGRRPQG